MIRSLYLFILIALLALGGVWLADNPGSVAIRWDNYIVETNVIVLALIMLIFALVVMLLYQGYAWMKASPGRLGGAFSARRRSKGLEALSNGMVAIAAGDADEARKAAVAAEKHLKGEPMTLLLAAQAAELNEDDRAAQIYYDRMTKREDTEFLGLRGLIGRAKADGDVTEALLHTKRADELKPGTEWVLKELLEIYLKTRQYEEADTVLARMARGKAGKSAKVRHLKAVISYERALAQYKAEEKTLALTLALQAHDLDPDFVPASALALYLSEPGRKRDKLINEIWRHTPHPDIAKAIKDGGPSGAASDWYLQVKRLLAPLKPDHRETALVMARAAFEAQEWGDARQYLDKAAQIDPSTSVYRLLAELEEKANADAAAARNWIIKSTEAPQDPLWICGNCGRQEPTWSTHCPSCDGFDSMTWRKPDRGHGADEFLEAEIVQEIEAPS